LEQEGWRVVRIWEHALRNDHGLKASTRTIVSALSRSHSQDPKPHSLGERKKLSRMSIPASPRSPSRVSTRP
jgi:hypothetical protein